MPGFDGTGPRGRGPMTGRGMGYCVFRQSPDKPDQIEGLAGLQGMPVQYSNRNLIEDEGEVMDMPRGDGTGPVGLGPMTGRAAGLYASSPVPGFLNPISGRGYPIATPYGYGWPYVAGTPGYRRMFWGPGFGRGFGHGRRFRGGRGRFGRA